MTKFTTQNKSKLCENLNYFLKGGYSSGHSGYGHSGYGHSGYGHSGYDHKASHSGYGHEEPCCPLVLDPLMLLALLGAIAAATYFLRSKIFVHLTSTVF